VNKDTKMTKEKLIITLKKIYDFFDDDTFYFAASLSFFTIFSMLPILALIIAVMSSYDIFASQIQMLLFYVLDFVNPTHSEQVIKSIEKFLVNIDKLGTLGFFYLLFVFTMFFKDYENIVSKIHETENRSFVAMALLYISFLFLIPLALIAFTFTATFFDSIYTKTILDFIFGMIFMTSLFKISINKPISFKAAIISAFLTLSILKLTQTMFLYYIVYSSTYSTIYGTLSALVFMFLWIYISWTIYLYGIKICHKLNIEYSK
jgi:membrane protein